MARTLCSSDFSNNFAKRLRTIRTYRGITQGKIAELLGIDTRTYQNFEADYSTTLRVPNFEIICEISNLLDCDITYLAGENQEYEFRKNTQHASETTGLDYDTVDKIEAYPPEVKQLIDRLVLHSNKDNLLKLLNAILAYSLYSHHAYIKLDVPGANIFEKNDIEKKLVNYSPSNPLNDISKKMLKYSVTSSLDEILTDTYNEYVEEGNLLLKQRLLERAEADKKRSSSLLEKRATLKECDKELSLDELNFLLDNTWDDRPFPTESEIHERIDEQYNHFYDFYKE